MQKVTFDSGKALADEFGIKFFETSAKLNTNVDKAFLSIASDIVERLKENPEHYGSEGGVALGVERGPHAGVVQRVRLDKVHHVECVVNVGPHVPHRKVVPLGRGGFGVGGKGMVRVKG